jgi:hypothetical protein
MTDAEPPHKTLYRWEKRQSTLDQPSKPTKHGKNIQKLLKNQQFIKINLDDIKAWLRQVENASSNAVETVFPRSSGRHTGKILANQAAVYAKTTDTTYTGKENLIFKILLIEKFFFFFRGKRNS